MSHVLPYLWYPLFLVAAIAGFSGMLAANVHVLVALYCTIVITGVAVVVLELLAPERLDWRPSRTDVVNDCIYMVVAQILTPRVLTMLAAVLIAGVTHEAPMRLWPYQWPHQWPVAGQALLMVLAVDLMRYWLHRACHTFTPLWRLHEVHHSPDMLYTLNTARFHPFEKVLHFSLDSVPFLLLGVAPEVIATYFLLYSVNGFFQHCNARLRYGWLNYVVASAQTHRWHHARKPKTASCNFSNTTIVWDLLFGTWYLPKNEELDVGIENRCYPKTFWAQMLVPFARAHEGDCRPSDGVGARIKSRLINAAMGVNLTFTDCLHRLQLRSALRDPMRFQRAVLAKILRANRQTRFGVQHGFALIANESDFRKRVSVQQFEDLRPFIDAEIATGEAALTQQAPIAYLRTSGTTGQPKDIPLTPSHLRQLQRWQRRAVAAQYHRCPGAFRGRILAVASASVEGHLDNGRPYGSASGIIAGSSPSLVRDKFVLPRQLAKIEDVATKYLLIVRFAVASRDITYLGTANPSTLLALVRLYREHEAAFINDVRHGGFFACERVPAEVWQAIRPLLAADPLRAEELQGMCEHVDHEGHQPAVQIGQLWPELRLVVTWTCASAGVALGALRTQLAKHTKVHELGYLSSEFMGTITFGMQAGSGLLTYDTHFFEFVERDLWDSDTPCFLTMDQLRKGRDYYVLVTTPSGLYRYFINDLIRVTGIVQRMPLVKFLQKGKGVTNITGEKLYEAQVLDAVHRVMAAMGLTARFIMAQADESARQYRLYVEARSVTDDVAASIDTPRLAAQVDALLCRLNIEYRNKRESTRLQPLVAFALRENTEGQFRAAGVAQGQREGQFKSVTLEYRTQENFDLDACVDSMSAPDVAPAATLSIDSQSP